MSPDREDKATVNFKSGSAPAGPVECPQCKAPVSAQAKVCDECGEELRDDRIGQIVGGRYRVDRLLGVGGFGRVYAGTHTSLGEPVAIKFLLSLWVERADVRARFRREAVTLAKLRHPGIVSVHDFGEHGEELFMAMELVRGRGLDKVIEAEGPALPVLQVLHWMDEILAVLEAAHGADIVHRDMKPENVMLLAAGDRTERIKVLDFGLALAQDTASRERLTASGTVQGTPSYMSPEQCRGRDVGPPTDIYAVGIMLFEMLSGRLPFDAPSMTDLIVKHMFVEPPTMRELGAPPDVTSAMESAVRRALSKEPSTRPSAAELRDLLKSIARGDDAHTVAELNVAARLSNAAQSREERALGRGRVPDERAGEGGRTADEHATVAGGRAPPVRTEGPFVVLWGFAPDRRDALQSALSVAGIRVRVCDAGETPPVAVGDVPVRVVAVNGAANPVEMLAALQKHDASKSVPARPAYVLDVASVGETSALIRAGAADVAYASTAVDAMTQRLWKLLKKATPERPR